MDDTVVNDSFNFLVLTLRCRMIVSNLGSRHTARKVSSISREYDDDTLCLTKDILSLMKCC